MPKQQLSPGSFLNKIFEMNRWSVVEEALGFNQRVSWNILAQCQDALTSLKFPQGTTPQTVDVLWLPLLQFGDRCMCVGGCVLRTHTVIYMTDQQSNIISKSRRLNVPAKCHSLSASPVHFLYWLFEKRCFLGLVGFFGCNTLIGHREKPVMEWVL